MPQGDSHGHHYGDNKVAFPAHEAEKAVFPIYAVYPFQVAGHDP